MVSQYLSSVAVVEPIKTQVCDVINRATYCATDEAAFLADRCAGLLAELRERGFGIDVLFGQDETPDFLTVLCQVNVLVRTSIRLYQSRSRADDRKAAISFFTYAEQKARHIGFEIAMMGDNSGLRVSFRPNLFPCASRNFL